MSHGWMRRGAPAGVSALLAFLAGTFANVFTAGWSWPVGTAMLVLAASWIGWEVWHSATRDEGTRDPPAPTPSGRTEGVAPPAQLPPDIASFAGRTAELAELDRLVDTAGETRTVVISTLSGTAGVGKPIPRF